MVDNSGADEVRADVKKMFLLMLETADEVKLGALAMMLLSLNMYADKTCDKCGGKK